MLPIDWQFFLFPLSVAQGMVPHGEGATPTATVLLAGEVGPVGAVPVGVAGLAGAQGAPGGALGQAHEPHLVGGLAGMGVCMRGMLSCHT